MSMSSCVTSRDAATRGALCGRLFGGPTVHRFERRAVLATFLQVTLPMLVSELHPVFNSSTQKKRTVLGEMDCSVTSAHTARTEDDLSTKVITFRAPASSHTSHNPSSRRASVPTHRRHRTPHRHRTSTYRRFSSILSWSSNSWLSKKVSSSLHRTRRCEALQTRLSASRPSLKVPRYPVHEKASTTTATDVTSHSISRRETRGKRRHTSDHWPTLVWLPCNHGRVRHTHHHRGVRTAHLSVITGHSMIRSCHQLWSLDDMRCL